MLRKLLIRSRLGEIEVLSMLRVWKQMVLNSIKKWFQTGTIKTKKLQTYRWEEEDMREKNKFGLWIWSRCLTVATESLVKFKTHQSVWKDSKHNNKSNGSWEDLLRRYEHRSTVAHIKCIYLEGNACRYLFLHTLTWYEPLQEAAHWRVPFLDCMTSSYMDEYSKILLCNCNLWRVHKAQIISANMGRNTACNHLA